MAHFDVRVSPRAQAQLNLLRAFDHVRIVEAIEENLASLVRSRNRKPPEPTPKVLADLFPSLLGDATVWELRVVPWRVAYAVEGQVVHVLFVFRKERGITDNALS